MDMVAGRKRRMPARPAVKRGPRPGGRILADALVAQGIDHVFEVPGESYLDVLDGLYGVRQDLQLITCRFEAGAAHMAEAYGKLHGRPAAAMVRVSAPRRFAAISKLTRVRVEASKKRLTMVLPRRTSRRR